MGHNSQFTLSHEGVVIMQNVDANHTSLNKHEIAYLCADRVSVNTVGIAPTCV